MNNKLDFGELVEAIYDALEDGRITLFEAYGIIRLIIKLLKDGKRPI